MRTPQDIINDLDDENKNILNAILMIEKEFQYITELSLTREKEIAEKIINVIEKEID